MKHVKGFIRRKSMLRVTKVEYGDYSMNHVLGCAHGCKYPCYAFNIRKRFGEVSDYSAWIEPYLVSNTLELLDEEIPKLKEKIKSVHLCFMTDPFMYEYDEISAMSFAAIKKLNEANIKCIVLTKGLLPANLSELSPINQYGITLTSLDENYRSVMEPYAASIKDRLDAARQLHDCGCKTWVSIEPYPTPNLIQQDLGALLNAASFSDYIVFGKHNYNPDVTNFPEKKQFYNDCANTVIDFCNSHNIAYHIKTGTITTEPGD